MINELINRIKQIEKTRLALYVVIYFLWGLCMNWIGQQFEIAKFTYWWQIITCYLLYMIPISILLRPYHFFTQYAYGLIAMGVLEFAGYALGTSIIYPDNILDRWFGPHVFALGMTLFFGWYFPVGNYVVNRLFLTLNRKQPTKLRR